MGRCIARDIFCCCRRTRHSCSAIAPPPFLTPQKSGAYIFRPKEQVSHPIGTASRATLDIVTGPVVNEARQAIEGGWVSQVYRLWNGSSVTEADWTVGPIDVSDQAGHEVITRYDVPGWATAGAWDSDSNCREWQHRVRDQRPSWAFQNTEPVAGEERVRE